MFEYLVKIHVTLRALFKNKLHSSRIYASITWNHFEKRYAFSCISFAMSRWIEIFYIFLFTRTIWKRKRLAIVFLQRFVDTCPKIVDEDDGNEKRNEIICRTSIFYPHIFEHTESSSFEREIAYNTFRALKTRELDRIIPTIQGIHLSLRVPDHVHARTAHLSRSTLDPKLDQLELALFLRSPVSSVSPQVCLSLSLLLHLIPFFTFEGTSLLSLSPPIDQPFRMKIKLVHPDDTFRFERYSRVISSTTGSNEGSRSSVNRYRLSAERA